LPKAGYFITDNLVTGLDFNIIYYKNKYGDNDYTSSATILSAGPFARLYIPSQRVIPFLEAGGKIGTSRSKYDYGELMDGSSKVSIMTFGGGIGMAVPLGERLTFDAMAGYSSHISKDKEDNEDNVRNISNGIVIKFGFVVLLGQ